MALAPLARAVPDGLAPLEGLGALRTSSSLLDSLAALAIARQSRRRRAPSLQMT